MTWQPQQQGLRELLFLLRDATDVSNPDQQLIYKRLSLFNEYPDYNSYLVYILTKLTNEDTNIRRIAGLQLKNNIKTNFNTFPLPVLNYIKQCCIHIFDENQPTSIRKTISIIIVSIICSGQVHNWLDMVLLLIEKLDDPNQIISKTALDTCVMICEDTASELDQEINGICPSSMIIPKLVQFYSHPDSAFRVQAIYATSQFVFLKSPFFIVQLDSILSTLYSQITREEKIDARVQREFINILSMLLEAFPERLEPYLHQTIEYIVNATIPLNRITDVGIKEQILISTCNFWIQYAQSEYYVYQTKIIFIKPYLPHLVKNLIQFMIYSESDLLDLDTDRHKPSFNPIQCPTTCINTIHEHDQSVQPRYYRPKKIDTEQDYHDKLINDFNEDSSEDEGEGQENCSNTQSTNDDDDSLSSGGDNNVEDDEFYSEDTLRKCSAAALDVLSVSFGDDIAMIILDHLFNSILLNENWLIRESGILALGAAAEGCIHVFSQYLHHLIPYLLKSMKDSKSLIRAISCWGTSRFSNWLVNQYDTTTTEMGTTFFEPVLFALLERLLDPNRRVQESACTAFIIFCETASSRIIPYIYPILTQFNHAFGFYCRKNRLILYDALGTFADSVGSELNQPQFISLLMPPLINKWNELSDNDTDLFPLLECLSNITAVIGPGFIQYVEPVLSRCVKLISSTLQQQLLADRYPDKIMPPNVDFLIAALDLLSGIVQGLGSKIEPLITQTTPPLLDLLGRCIHNPVPEVLQSTFALIGYISIACFNLLVPFLNDIMNELLHVLYNCNDGMVSSVSVYNNALWAIGEMIIRWRGQETEPYMTDLIKMLIVYLTHPEAPLSIHKNAMIALGRFGLACPQLVAPYLASFIKSWLKISLSVPWGEEKDSAFKGLCTIIKLNVKDAQNDLYLLLSSISSIRSPSQDLWIELNDVVKGYYSITSHDEWNYIISQLDPDAQKQILSLLVEKHS
ncbi:transportin-1-like protein [Cokeromyces recurvatus]|uniref:transportin-1-like protein n=1 Tax=Cokeromyces recurvatus TaxID=90255 RepID=UPI00221F0439|nr:transportin-1-like protein [Cokeromyces recurvatus]KAI7904534.1 transportin-1-like protein [Cokeromyces recurvatus]